MTNVKQLLDEMRADGKDSYIITVIGKNYTSRGTFDYFLGRRDILHLPIKQFKIYDDGVKSVVIYLYADDSYITSIVEKITYGKYNYDALFAAAQLEHIKLSEDKLEACNRVAEKMIDAYAEKGSPKYLMCYAIIQHVVAHYWQYKSW